MCAEGGSWACWPPEKSPDTPGSPEGNTEGPGTGGCSLVAAHGLFIAVTASLAAERGL